MGVEPMAFGL